VVARGKRIVFERLIRTGVAVAAPCRAISSPARAWQ
jgi:hypothetical protein